MSLAAKVAIVTRCAPGIDARGLHKTNLAALRDALAQWPARAASACQRRLSGRRAGPPPAGGDRRGRQERRDRRRLGAGQGDPRPLHAPRRHHPPGLGVRPARRLLDAGAPRRDRASRASRRCIGCPSSRRPTSSWRSAERPGGSALVGGACGHRSKRRHQNAPSRCSRATSRPAPSKVTPIASKRSAAARGRSERSCSQRAAIRRTCARLPRSTASNGVPAPPPRRRALTSQKASVRPS